MIPDLCRIMHTYIIACYSELCLSHMVVIKLKINISEGIICYFMRCKLHATTKLE